MLAVFNKSVASIPIPEYLKLDESVSAFDEEDVVSYFMKRHPDSVSIDLKPSGVLCVTPDHNHPIISRNFGVKDDIFCLFQGKIDNLSNLPMELDVNEEEAETQILIDGYRTLRQGDSYWFRLLNELDGRYSIIIYDNKEKRLFASTDNNPTDGLLFFWGINGHEDLILTNDEDVLQKYCGQAFGLFPKGCYISTLMGPGVRSFEAEDIMIDPVYMLEKFHDDPFPIQQVED